MYVINSFATSNFIPVEKITASRAAGKEELSEYGLKRASRDLLRMAADFGLLTGSAVREFKSYHLPEKSFLYLLHAMYEVHGNARDVVHSQEWRLFLMSTADVERELFRLHQFRKLRYEVAGSLVELTLPVALASGTCCDVCRSQNVELMLLGSRRQFQVIVNTLCS